MNTKKVAEAIKAGQVKQDRKLSSLQMLSKAFENIHKKEQE